jgi:protein-disulfide isomerase
MPQSDRISWLALGIWLSALPALEATPVLEYLGRLSVQGTNYTGPGGFLFSIQGRTGPLWSTGPVPVSGSSVEIPDSVLLPVTDGSYTVQLGEANSGSPSIPESVLEDSTAKLVVWFRDARHGWRRIAVEALPIQRRQDEGTAAGTPMAAQLDQIVRELKDMHRDIHALDKSGAANAADAGAKVPPAEIVTLPVNDSPALGSAEAPVVLVEFTDFQCGFCRQFHETVFPQLVKEYVEKGKLRIISRNLTLPFHAQAEPAARAALCGREQNKFWAMREQLFARTATLSATAIDEAATESGLDMSAFRACLTGNSVVVDQIKRDGHQAQVLGIEGTPTFILGRVTNGQITGAKIIGVRPYSAFDAEVKKALAAAEKKG